MQYLKFFLCDIYMISPLMSTCLQNHTCVLTFRALSALWRMWGAPEVPSSTGLNLTYAVLTYIFVEKRPWSAHPLPRSGKTSIRLRSSCVHCIIKSIRKRGCSNTEKYHQANAAIQIRFCKKIE